MVAALERVQPQLAACGHIHEAHGRFALGATTIVNASLVNQSY